MGRVIIACKTVEQELLAAMAQTQCSDPILWLESGLHNWPDKLRQRIQTLLDGCNGYDTVLLAMSFCGNSVVGLHTHGFQLVVPRCDDCITLLLGSPARRQTIKAAYFLTEGWLKGELNIWEEYRHCLSKYGEARGKEIFSLMFAHYRKLALLDCGCSDAAQLERQVREIARELKLEYIRLDGTLEYLKQLLTGPWEEDRFLVVSPGNILNAQM